MSQRELLPQTKDAYVTPEDQTRFLSRLVGRRATSRMREGTLLKGQPGQTITDSRGRIYYVMPDGSHRRVYAK